jgi:long-subunit acyl-CoA synthetase (AMP-forming)
MSPFTKKYSLKGLKAVNIGAAPLGRESQDRFRELLEPGVPVTQVWGMTEASCVATKFYYPENDTSGSVGRLMPNLDAK